MKRAIPYNIYDLNARLDTVAAKAILFSVLSISLWNFLPNPTYAKDAIQYTQDPQIRVYGETIEPSNGISQATVYRIPAHQQVGEIMTDSQGQTLSTDNDGYLQGHGELVVGDRLVALYPITRTVQYTTYKTSAAPNVIGLDTFKVTNPGVQELVVSADHTLTIFDLSISLEWDARKDTAYIKQLESDLNRTSELLYDVTNGQAALGQITIYHNKKRWNEVDIRIYATNRMRPHATIGGLNQQLRSMTLEPSRYIDKTITKVYLPGQVHMPATWNRTGESSGNLGEDWPRTLVHELGHYFFYLLENYMGLDDQGLPSAVNTCQGIMGNSYLVLNSELHPDHGWQKNCSKTLQHQTMGRSDWETVQAFYPWFHAPLVYNENYGPTTLPLAITKINFVAPKHTANTLDVAMYYLIEADGERYNASSDAQAYLFKENRIIDLGQPHQNRLQVWGAELNDEDRICVYDLGPSPPKAGCKGTIDQIEQLTMQSWGDWQPEMTLTAISSRTLTIEISNLSPDMPMKARIYPTGLDDRPATPPITLTYESDTNLYRGVFELINPPYEAKIHVWSGEKDGDRKEAMLDYKLNGAPILRLGDLTGLRLDKGGTLMLSDGTVVALEGDNLILGNGNTVMLSDGSTLMLSDGTTLMLSDGTTLMLSDGGTLMLSDGTTLMLSDGMTLMLSDGTTLVLDVGITQMLSDGTTLILSDGGTQMLSDGTTLMLSNSSGTSLVSDGANGNTLMLSDGGTLQLSDGSTYILSDGNGPILSSDGQVQIFGEALDFPAYEFYAFQSVSSLPDVPIWTTLVGQGYRLTRSSNAPDLAENSISFRYLGRNVPPGEERFLSIYHYDGNNWSPLETTIDFEQNLAVAPIGDAGEGIYALMSTIDIPLDGPGWILFGYPIYASRPITEALRSIEGDYHVIYTHQGQGRYNVNAPAHTNTLTHLEFAQAYWVYLSRSATLYLKGNEEVFRP